MSYIKPISMPIRISMHRAEMLDIIDEKIKQAGRMHDIACNKEVWIGILEKLHQWRSKFH